MDPHAFTTCRLLHQVDEAALTQQCNHLGHCHVLEDVPKVEATAPEEPLAVYMTVQHAPSARLRHRSEEQDELLDEADT